MILFIHMKKCKEGNHTLLMTYCLLLLIALVSLHHVISSGAQKNMTLRILPLYIFFGLNDVILKQNKQTEKEIVRSLKRKKNE